MKVNVFDNNVIITGANLSDDYFTDRQDRYYLFRNCAPLANYFSNLISTLTDLSYNINDQGQLQMI